MLQVYDRVLGSGSEATLVALSVLVVFLFLMMGILDHVRGRIMARIGAKFQDRLDRRVFQASVRRMQLAPNDPAALAAQRDLEAVQRLWASPVLLAVFDIPWTPVFIAAIFIFHPLMGWLAVVGGILLVTLTVLNQRMTKNPLNQANMATMRADRMAENLKARPRWCKRLA
jgi:ATP-binding cassette, subfamily C, bacterial